MQYRYASNQNYEDFASGRVIYHQKGMTNFPVRLGQEIFHRSLQYLKEEKPVCLYDCCCGGGYLLTVLGFLNAGKISRIIGSDVDAQAVAVARKNLSLLTADGMNLRQEEIRQMAADYQKASHQAALLSGCRLNKMRGDISIACDVRVGNVFDGIVLPWQPDLIMTDLPYGRLVSWQGEITAPDSLLTALLPLAGKETVIAVSMDRHQRLDRQSYRVLEHERIGKRQFLILRKG